MTDQLNLSTSFIAQVNKPDITGFKPVKKEETSPDEETNEPGDSFIKSRNDDFSILSPKQARMFSASFKSGQSPVNSGVSANHALNLNRSSIESPLLGIGNTASECVPDDRAGIIKNMFATDTPVRISDQEASQLTRSLSVVSSDVLRFAKQRGLKFQAVHEGDNLSQLKVIRPQEPMKEKLPGIRELRKSIENEVATRFDSRLQEIDRILDENSRAIAEKHQNRPTVDVNADNFMSILSANYTPPDPETVKLIDERSRLESEKKKFFEVKLKESGLDIKSLSDESIMSGLSPAVQKNLSNIGESIETDSLEYLAIMHGAKTPEEKKEFFDTMSALNGETLKKAQEERLKQEESNIEFITDPEEKKAKQAQIEDMRKNPEKISLSYKSGEIFVPDMYYYHSQKKDENGQGMRVDRHDYETLDDWNDESGTVKPANERNTTGQHFSSGGINRIIISDDSLGERTPVHELGHSIESLLKEEDPEFYKEFSRKAEEAYNRVDTEGGPQRISNYSRKSSKEYIADGFSFYYNDRELLKTKDPALYSLIEELTKRASELGAQK